jgi:hypothetical protein
MRRLLLVTLALATGQAATAQEATTLNLVCFGDGAANKQRGGTFNAWNNDGDSASGTVTQTSREGFADQVNVQITGSEGRLRMPRAMLPLLRGGKEGWFTLKNIKVTDADITGSVAVNPLNNPKMRIDRYTGVINLAGKAGDFVGKCQAYDPTKVERQF